MIQLCLSWLINEGTEREQRGNREKKNEITSFNSEPKRSMKNEEDSEKTMRTMKNKGNREEAMRTVKGNEKRREQ